MPTRRQVLHLAAGSAALATTAGITWAQAYPTRPVRILVGFAAGGNFDIVARLIGQWLSEQLQQPVIVENRPGASSNIATEAVVRAPADGYTLLLGGAVNAVNATLYEKLGFNFISDIAPVAGVVRFPNVMTVSASFPAKTVPEFIAYAKANPGKINQGSSGNGTTQHLAGELFKMMTGVDFVHVPYRGASQAMTDLLGGQVQVLFEPLPPSIQHIRSGTASRLGGDDGARSEALPDLPTVGEFVPGYEASGWNGVCAPKNTPVEIIEKLNRDQCGPCRSQGEGAPRRPGRHDAWRLVRRVRKAHRRRDREVGQGHPRSQHQAGVTGSRAPFVSGSRVDVREVQPVQADLAHLGLARFDMTCEELHGARRAAGEHCAQDLSVLQVGVDDALGMREVQAPHDADALGDRLVHARELGIAGGLDQGAVEFLVQARDARAVGEPAARRHQPGTFARPASAAFGSPAHSRCTAAVSRTRRRS